MEIEREPHCLRIRAVDEDAGQAVTGDPQLFARWADAAVDDRGVGKEIAAVFEDELQRWVGRRDHEVEPPVAILLSDVVAERTPGVPAGHTLRIEILGEVLERARTAGAQSFG